MPKKTTTKTPLAAKERTKGNPKSKIGKKAATQNKRNMKKGY